VLKSDGAVAWIATNFLGTFCISPPGPAIEVRRHDRRGLRVVASGTGIVPTSLHLSGSVLHWIDGGMARSATLL
jgi:FtsP/CotA-like multicopper oxidase with cupredoxin domain